MQLTPPQTPQEDEVEAPRIGLSGYNVIQAGPFIRSRTTRYFSNYQICRWSM